MFNKSNCIICLLGSTIGVNAQSVMYSAESYYRYGVVQEESLKDTKEINTLVIEKEIPQVLAEEAAFKLDITISYLGGDGYIDYILVLRE